MDRLKQQIEFIVEIDKLKQITRQTYLADGSRKENDTEHSWHLAMMAMLLSQYANEPVDVLKVIKIVLIHDIIEIDAGDTYAYDEAGNVTKKERESKAADRIYSLLPKDQGEELRGLWEEFEACKSPEAKFARALDNVQPLLLNHHSGGRSWREHGVERVQVEKRNEKTPEGSLALWNLVKEIIDENQKKGNLK